MPLVGADLRHAARPRNDGQRLTAAAHAVNRVWNNGAQVYALTHNQKWPEKAEPASLTKGAGKLIGVPAQTIQGVVAEYVDRRRATRKTKLRWRGKCSLGWIPFPCWLRGPFQWPQPAPTAEASVARKEMRVSK
jgi:hypothetical protein